MLCFALFSNTNTTRPLTFAYDLCNPGYFALPLDVPNGDTLLNWYVNIGAEAYLQAWLH